MIPLFQLPTKSAKTSRSKKSLKFFLKLSYSYLSFFGISYCSKSELKPMLSLQVPQREEEMKVDNDHVDEVIVVDSVEISRVKRAVKGISFGGEEEKKAAMAEMKRLMVESGGRMRRVMAELGVIPSLVGMIFDVRADISCTKLAVGALVEIAYGSFRNKKLIVEAGFLSKLPQLIHCHPLLTEHQFALLLLSVSSLATTTFPISATNILPLLLETITSDQTREETKLTSISALHNLSANLSNSKPISTSGLIHAVLAMSSNKLVSEIALSTLGNLALSSTCKKLIVDDPLVPKVFIEILAWEDSPKCQEIITYLLMIVAHESRRMRMRMERLGVVKVLVEVALLGSPLARKRAVKLVEWLKDEKRGRVAVHSGPQARRVELAGGEDEEEAEESRRAVQKMVKQSLDRSMELIMMRASGGERDSGLRKVMAASIRSKSMPY